MSSLDGKPDTFSKRIAIGSLVVSCTGAVVALSALLSTWCQHAETVALTVKLEQLRVEREKPSLEANAMTFSPDYGRPGPTNLPLFNPGKQEALVTKVDFVIVERFETPKEGPKCGAVPVVPVVFDASEYDEPNRRFSVTLQRPIGIPGGRNVVLQMSIVEPQWGGFSYAGNVLIHYDRGEPLLVSGVILDVLLKASVEKSDD